MSIYIHRHMRLCSRLVSPSFNVGEKRKEESTQKQRGTYRLSLLFSAPSLHTDRHTYTCMHTYIHWVSSSFFSLSPVLQVFLRLLENLLLAGIVTHSPLYQCCGGFLLLFVLHACVHAARLKMSMAACLELRYFSLVSPVCTLVFLIHTRLFSVSFFRSYLFLLLSSFVSLVCLDFSPPSDQPRTRRLYEPRL